MNREEFEKRRERWAVQKQQGKTKYVLKYGVLAWGIVTAVVITLIKVVINGEALVESFISLQFLVRLVLFMAGGIVFGHFLWKSNSAKYD